MAGEGEKGQEVAAAQLLLHLLIGLCLEYQRPGGRLWVGEITGGDSGGGGVEKTGERAY